VIAEDAQGLVFLRPDAQFTAAFGAGRNDIRYCNDLRSTRLTGFMF
jgi:hypothetical protein